MSEGFGGKRCRFGAGPFLEATGLEDVMLRGSVQSGRFEASGKVLEGSELGSASWL